MAIKLGPCAKCGEPNCEWRSRAWRAEWMLHDPEGYSEWAWWTARKEVEEERADRRRRQLWRRRRK